jgi:hypothetical protein
VWLPKYVPSEITSLNQNDILAINKTNVAGNHNPDASNPCMFETADVVKVNKLIHVKRGQGEGETRWKG